MAANAAIQLIGILNAMRNGDSPGGLPHKRDGGSGTQCAPHSAAPEHGRANRFAVRERRGQEPGQSAWGGVGRPCAAFRDGGNATPRSANDLPAAHRSPAGRAFAAEADREAAAPHAITSAIAGPLSETLRAVANIAPRVGRAVDLHDPLNVPVAQAAQIGTSRYVGEAGDALLLFEDINAKLVRLDRVYYDASQGGGSDRFVSTARQALTQFYATFDAKNPSLRTLANTLLRQAIAERFKLDIDPERSYFMHFAEIMWEGGRKTQYAPATQNRTLTEWLFTNFDAQTQDNIVDMDAMCGLYDASLAARAVFDSRDAIRIKPSDFIQLVWDIDFAQYARRRLNRSFGKRGLHIKKLLLDFVGHLDSADIDDRLARDILGGAGLMNARNVWVSPFDIDGYAAANAFVFRNRKAGRVALYFPRSDFKFIGFKGDLEMRAWVASACSSIEHRAMIASHFTIASRQDGLFYYGVDAWLNSIGQDSGYVDKVAAGTSAIPAKRFFAVFFGRTRDQAISDLDHLVKSDAKVRRDMWEEMADASNVIPNPVSPFLSLGFHLEHAIDADTYEEKVREWRKIQGDAIDFIAMVVLHHMISKPYETGYRFLRSVRRGMVTGRIDTGGTISDMQCASRSEQLATDSGSPGGARAVPGAARPVSRGRRLSRFLPLRSFPPMRDVVGIHRAIEDHAARMLGGHPFDIFYGFDLSEGHAAPAYIEKARRIARQRVRSATATVRAAEIRLHDDAFGARVNAYLSSALDTRDERIVAEAASRLRAQVQCVSAFLRESAARAYGNFGIVSTRQVPEAGNPSFFRSAIGDTRVLDNVPFGFTSQVDPYRRIFLMNDVNSLIEEAGRRTPGSEGKHLEATVIHEASHASSYTRDFLYNQINHYLEPDNAQLLLRRFDDAVQSGELGESDDFIDFMNDVFLRLGMAHPVEPRAALEFLKSEPMLRANMMMGNADNFVVYVRELSRMSRESRSKRGAGKVRNDAVDKYLRLIFMAARVYRPSA